MIAEPIIIEGREMPTELIILRHAKDTLAPNDQTWLEKLKVSLGRLDAAFSSPRTRARETARLLGFDEFKEDERLVEVLSITRLPLPGVRRLVELAYLAFASILIALPGLRNYMFHKGAEFVDAMREIASTVDGGRAVVVTHGGVMFAALCLLNENDKGLKVGKRAFGNLEGMELMVDAALGNVRLVRVIRNSA